MCKSPSQPLFAGLVTTFLLIIWLIILKFFVMVKHCVVQFCSNSNKTGHTMHKFPKEANLKRQWVKFVQVKRADFDQRSKHSVVCGSHLSPDCYGKSYMVEMGL